MSQAAAQTHTAYIALGSNIGEREATIRSAVTALAQPPQIQVVRCSRLIETEPIGMTAGGMFLNAAAEVRTTLPPRALLERTLAVERAHGRTRRTPGCRRADGVPIAAEPRTLDIDLLLYGEQVIDEPGLTVPHPRMHERAFVLQPLAEIAPHARHPVLGVDVQSLVRRLSCANAE